MIKQLQEIGLSKTEAEVYLALWKNGKSTANIIAEKSGIHRRTVYDNIETLIEKGLISFHTENKRKVYIAENPKKIIEILENRKKDFLSILPDLLKNKTKDEEIEIRVYRGKKAFRNIYDSMIKNNCKIYSFGSNGKFRELLGEIYYERWLKEFEKKKCSLKIILSLDFKDLNLPSNIKVKKLPKNFVLPSAITFWEDNIFIQIFNEAPVGILIKSKEAIRSHKEFFDFLWKASK